MSRLVHPLLSRKLWMAIFGVVVEHYEAQFPGSRALIAPIAVILSSYLFGQAIVDYKLAAVAPFIPNRRA